MGLVLTVRADLACKTPTRTGRTMPELANVGPVALSSRGADRGSVACTLRRRRLRAHSEPADGRRGHGRRCRSRFQRFRCRTPISSPPTRKSRRTKKRRRTSQAARTPTTARLARAGNQASSSPPTRQSRRTQRSRKTSLAARTPRMGRKTTRTSVPRFPIRSPRLRTRSRRFLWRGRRLLIRSPRFRTQWRRFLWRGRRLLIRSPRFRTRSRRFLWRGRRLLMWWWRRFPMWSGQFQMSARWFRTC